MPEVGSEADQRHWRTLDIGVPLHLAALFILTVATYQMMQSEVIAASTGTGRDPRAPGRGLGAQRPDARRPPVRRFLVGGPALRVGRWLSGF